ncbi:hypothetical protein FEM48_Zijuj12G0158100 [Ziziphus jujuba var. spinosa]|uniref:Uncharacterized protein n=1 Tax=Ziziphus jujuba var. spinosa TaxID=714518 RepID=A0A978UE83_ZIZJJ|nr:hypothetical protein FEM48_Zijuj12G0158100 [Ziziphus jujuba var. spinosa]
MSLESSTQYSSDQPSEMNKEARKKVTKSYTRDFLLSLSNLDVCKKLPSGLDRSILSELEDASQERPRISSGLSLNSFRRSEYGSSPPTRGDLLSFSRGVHGRWESRSSGRSDKDSDSQSEWDSDSGRRNSNQSRRSWQVPEHDGLLGSGSFPRPSGFAAGVSAPKIRPNEHYQLNRSNGPYHPPRPYKAVPHSRRETNDSYNDETFASFELMRKEQHKSFQEKKKLGLDKSGSDFDITTLMDGSKDEEKLLNRSNKSNDSVIPSASDNDSKSSSVPPQTLASRPLVPPGFTSTVLDRNVGAKSVNHPDATEVRNLEIEDNFLHAQSNLVSSGNSNNQVEKQLAQQLSLSKQQHEDTSSYASTINKNERVLDTTMDIDGKLYKKSNLSQAFEASNNSETMELNVEKVMGDSLLGESNPDHSTSILDKLFGSALTLKNGGSSNLLEDQDAKADETHSPQTVHSSKFAYLFLEEEKKHGNDHSSGRSNDLLSLIGGGEKGGSLVSGSKNEKISPNLPFQTSEPVDQVMTSNMMSTTIDTSEQLNKTNKGETVSAVLTCEDLEQSILLGIDANGSSSQPPVQSWSDPDGKTEQRTANIDNHASQHLLSLLQKGTSLNDKESSTNPGTSADSLHATEGVNTSAAFQNLREANSENVSNSSNTLTLETLFGTAFMQELQSVGAPVSVQRAPAGAARVDVSEPHGLPFPVKDESLVPSTNEIGFSTAVHGGNVLIANKRKQTKGDRTDEQWLAFDDPQARLNNTSQIQINLGSKVGGFDVPADIPLPEEDSLITATNPPNHQNFMPSGSFVKTELPSSSNPQVDIAEKLAAFNSAFKDERSARGGQEPPFFRGPYDKRESDIPYQNLNVQPSSAQLHHPRLNNMGPLFHPMDSHPVNMNSQMKFLASEANIHHDPPNHQIPADMLRPPFHHPSTGLPGFDQPIHHPMLQQIHMQGNFPPPHMLQGLSRGPPLPSHPSRGAHLPAHPNSQVTGFVQDLNPMPNVPFGHRQPNFGSLGMPPPAHDVGGGSSHPEAFQRLLEMELRANPKQIHPFAPGGHSQGMFGHELDMGFGYR